MRVVRRTIDQFGLSHFIVTVLIRAMKYSEKMVSLVERHVFKTIIASWLARL